ncbi:MAG: hypothetical protein CVU39_10305 [Chloroflexi bacterium HGW-Chloroflexi-10]|nr:MAG: hypothetical protein CVU39_10305 [Chloroflexi bacterium HGW-Chloroflexi-10]
MFILTPAYIKNNLFLPIAIIGIFLFFFFYENSRGSEWYPSEILAFRSFFVNTKNNQERLIILVEHPNFYEISDKAD